MATDLVQKHIFKAKVKGLGKSLGVDSSNGAGTFATMFTNGPSSSDSDIFAEDGPTAPFANAPANYPPSLNIVYIDRGILSEAAQPALNKIHAIFAMSTTLPNLLHLRLRISAHSRLKTLRQKY